MIAWWKGPLVGLGQTVDVLKTVKFEMLERVCQSNTSVQEDYRYIGWIPYSE